MGQAAALWTSLAASGVDAYNDNRVQRKQDEQLANSLLNQSRLQQKADAQVSDEVDKLAGSTAADERRQRLDEYMQTLRRNQATTDEGLNPTIGSNAFRADSRKAAGKAGEYAATAADLMARMDAPQLQRQGEAFDYGRLATDLSLARRQSAGQRYVDDLRMRSIRRDPALDFLAAAGRAYANSAATNGGNSQYMPVEAEAIPLNYGATVAPLRAKSPGVF